MRQTDDGRSSPLVDAAAARHARTGLHPHRYAYGMAGIDLVDETFIAADVHDVAAIVHDEPRWSVWFPDKQLTVFMDRGVKGIRWSVRGKWIGSTEIWLEESGDGVILHYYLRVEPASASNPGVAEPYPDTDAGYRAAARARVAAATRWKHLVWRLKDELEGDRVVGTPARRRQMASRA